MSRHSAAADGQLRGAGLRYEVGSRVILDGIDVTAEAGQMLAVSGPSGAGKSSLLSLLTGLLRPSAGTVTLNGDPVTPGDVELRRSIGLVLQGYGLVSALTARENVAIALQTRKLPRAEIRERTADALDAVGLTAVADHLIEDLSGGQQQRVAVARAIVGAPAVLVADEPTSELDAENRGRIVELLAATARDGTIVVLASHDHDVVAACDAHVRLEAGARVG